MKKQKRLPELFYIQENEKTNEYCAKLAIKRGRGGLTIIDDFGDYLVFKENRYKNAFFKKNFKYLQKKYPDAVFVDLADYIEKEQPEQKWQDKTRGGYEYHIYEEFDGLIFGRLKKSDNKWLTTWDLSGAYIKDFESAWDLLPINHELTTLEKELEEVRLKAKEILEKIEGLKK